MKRIQNVNRWKCLLTLLFSAAVVICVCVGVVMNLTTLEDENFDHMGIETFCMFTVNSNIFMGIAMFLTLPYTVDGLRNGYFRLPDWLVKLLFVASTALSLTFLVSLFILAPVKGFVLIFTGSRFFLHGLCPILAIATFCFVLKDTHLPFGTTFLSLIPVFLYACIYYTMVAVVGEEKGGWNDFYGFLTRIPPWISMSAFLPITFGIATVLRILHNKSCKRYREQARKQYQEAFHSMDMREVVIHLAARNSKKDTTGNIVIPYHVLRMLLNSGEDEQSFEDYCILYMKECLKHEITQE
ncbi:MAG: hypothetical protein Q4A88_05445 [Clostridia bacterium]|nr:hypothetical protein [Clostridia bacterium]